MNSWIEYEGRFFNLSQYNCVGKTLPDSIFLTVGEYCDQIHFQSTEERDKFFDQIRFKLFPDRFGGIPC